VRLSEEEAEPLLKSGEIVGGRRLAWGSNYTFLVHIATGPGEYLRAVYKPRDGEQPLHDFPGGTLYKREYATFLVSRALGWPRIPVTVIRDGPYGDGSMQHFIESEPDVTYFDLAGERNEELYQMAVFDLLVNNADRKAGHCLLDSEGLLWSIDHGLTFHPDFKVRTVMVDLWGQSFPTSLLPDLEALVPKLETKAELAESLATALSQEEITTLRSRLDAMLADPVLPRLDRRRNVPWPLV
jgi:hypothetical protein